MKLSIIIPAYNVEQYIKRTINSLSVQTKKQFEIIIVDDGSIDNTLKVIEETIIENNLNNCKVIIKKNGGVSSARNEGMREASGKYIMFLDGDDYVSIDFMENIYKFIDNKESDIICWGYNNVDENTTTIQNYFDIYNLKHESMAGIEALNNIFYYKNMWIFTGSVVYKKEFLMQYNLKYTEGCANGEDQEFTIKALCRASEVVFIDKILSYYVQRETSISNSYNIKRFDVVAAMKRVYKYIENIGDSKLEIIYTTIKNEHIVDHYIYNFDYCFSVIYKNCTVKESFYKLYDDIEREYPNLNKEMISIMKNYKGNNIRMLFKVKIFLISPLMYIRILSLKNKINRIRFL
jgi:glycosyltransferase involved in cell wall biosynthesis